MVRDLSYFLGGWTDRKQDEKSVDGDKPQFAPNSAAVDAAIEFTIKTKRFGQSIELSDRKETIKCTETEEVVERV